MREIATMPLIPCACGCGELIPPINTNLKPAKYKHGHNPRTHKFPKGNHEIARMGAKALWDKRGRGKPFKVKGGYYRVGIPVADAHKHPTALRGKNGGASIMRSHLIWNEAHPDDLVQKGETIHHLNHVRDDDRAENFVKLSRSAHARLHNELREARERNVLGQFT